MSVRLALASLVALFALPSIALAQRVEIRVETPPPPTVVLIPSAPPSIPPIPPIPPIPSEPGPSPAAASDHEPGSTSIPARLAGELLFGFTHMDPAVDGGSFGLGLHAEVAPLRWLALGVRGGWSTRQDPGIDLDLDGRDDVEDGSPINLLTITAGPRFRLSTGESSHDAFVIELGAGYASVLDGLRPSGAMLELALSRWGDAGGVGGGPVVRLQQGLGDAGSLTTVLVGVQGGINGTSSEPTGRSSFRYTFGGDVAMGGGFLEQGLVSHGFAIQLGMSMGLPLADVIEPRVRFDFGHRMAGEERDGLETYAASGGLRLLLDPWIPLYVEAGAGWAFRFGTRAAEIPGGAFLDVGAGARFQDCEGSQIAVTLGVRGRIGLEAADALTAIYGTIGVEYDALPPAMRPRCVPAPPAPAPRADLKLTATVHEQGCLSG